MKAACVDHFDAMDCNAAATFCGSEIEEPFFSTGKNPYDISKDCDGPLSETLCYPITKYVLMYSSLPFPSSVTDLPNTSRTIKSYLDKPSVRRTLGVDPSVGNFTSCSYAVSGAFGAKLDGLQPTQDWVAALLERGVRALIYVGTYDWICNWVGNEAFTLAMEWSGQEAFVKAPLEEWKVEGKTAGKVRSAGPLTFVTVDAAGHMVPLDKPREALELVNRWLNEKDI